MKGYDTIAADITDGDGLKALGCPTVILDVTSPQSIQQFALQHGDKPLDLLLNVAGVLFENDSLETVELGVLQKTFSVNTYGPLLLTQALLPALLKSKNPRLGFVSSRVGSITDNSTGGSYAYRASKAALNSICKSMAMDLKDKNVVVVILHPGIVKSGLVANSGQIKEAVMPDEAAGKLWKVLMSKNIDQTGTFWHREGFELPW